MNRIIILSMMVMMSGCAQFKENAISGWNNLNNTLAEDYYKRKFAQTNPYLIDNVKNFHKKSEEIENLKNKNNPLFSNDNKGKVRGSYIKNNKISYNNAKNISWHISKLKKEIGEMRGNANLLKFEAEDVFNRIDMHENSKIAQMILNTPKEVDAFNKKYSDKNLTGFLNKEKARLSIAQKADWKLFQRIHKEMNDAYKSHKYQTVLNKYDALGPNSTCEMQEQVYVSKRELGKLKKFDNVLDKERFDIEMQTQITDVMNCYNAYLDRKSLKRVSNIGLKYGDLLTKEQEDKLRRAAFREQFGY